MNPTHLPGLMILSLHTQDACLKLWRGCRLTQMWEASLWLAGKQMYLGGFQDEDDAARAYDLAALACKGPAVPTNFPAEGYSDSLAEIGGSSRVRAALRMLPYPCVGSHLLS